MKKYTLILALIAAITSITASAVTIRPCGAYVSGYGGYAKLNKSLDNGASTKNHGGAWGANIGYKFNPYFSVESGLTWLPKIKSGSTTAVDSNYLGDAAFKVIAPFKNGVGAFIKLGGAYEHMKIKNGYTIEGRDGNQNEWTGLGGLGITWNMTPNVQLVVQGITTLERKSIPANYLALGGLSYIF